MTKVSGGDCSQIVPQVPRLRTLFLLFLAAKGCHFIDFSARIGRNMSENARGGAPCTLKYLKYFVYLFDLRYLCTLKLHFTHSGFDLHVN